MYVSAPSSDAEASTLTHVTSFAGRDVLSALALALIVTVAVGVGGTGVAVGSGVGVRVGVNVAVAVGVGVGMGVRVGVNVAVAVGSGVGVRVGVNVAVAVGIGVGVRVGMDVAVAVGIDVGVGVGADAALTITVWLSFPTKPERPSVKRNHALTVALPTWHALSVKLSLYLWCRAGTVKPVTADEQLELKLAREFTPSATSYLSVLSKFLTLTVKPSLSPFVM